LDRAGMHAAGIASRELLRERERDELLALGHGPEETLLLVLGAAHQDGERAERVHRVEDADAAAGAREFLDADAEVDDAAALPAVFLGDPDAHEAGLGERLLDLPRVFLSLVVFGGERTDDLFGDLARPRAPHEILFGEESGQEMLPSRFEVADPRAVARGDWHYLRCVRRLPPRVLRGPG